MLKTGEGLWIEPEIVPRILRLMESRTPVTALHSENVVIAQEYTYLVAAANEYLSQYPEQQLMEELYARVRQDTRDFLRMCKHLQREDAEIEYLAACALGDTSYRYGSQYGSHSQGKTTCISHPINALVVLQGGPDVKKVKCFQCGEVMLPTKLFSPN